MRRLKPLWQGAAFLAVAFLGGMAGSRFLQPEAPSAGMVEFGARGETPGVVATFGVGGVMTWEGELWQYRPDKKAWVTLDESFALEGQATKAVPLPVKPENIRHMETFGFLVDRDDTCWLYNIDEQRWESVGQPPFHVRR